MSVLVHYESRSAYLDDRMVAELHERSPVVIGEDARPATRHIQGPDHTAVAAQRDDQQAADVGRLLQRAQERATVGRRVATAHRASRSHRDPGQAAFDGESETADVASAFLQAASACDLELRAV